jgi:AcrR family transcriptional regulator
MDLWAHDTWVNAAQYRQDLLTWRNLALALNGTEKCGGILTAFLEITSAPLSRKASKAVRQQQLIDATISVLARKGFSALTVADVAKAAGLSVGIIIFHFESKEKLLSACLAYLADEYYRNWKRAFMAPNTTSAEKLQLVLLTDFDETIFTQEKLSAWIAFWGETQGRPTYEEICSARDIERAATIEKLCAILIEEAGYTLAAKSTMRALECIGDGLWLGTVSGGKSVTVNSESAEEARTTINLTLAAFFPKHYPS